MTQKNKMDKRKRLNDKLFYLARAHIEVIITCILTAIKVGCEDG